MKKARHKKTSIVGVKELRTNLEKYISRVDKGESFMVVRRSKPVFRIMPAIEEVDEQIDEPGWDMIDFRDKNGKGIPIEEVMKALRRRNA